MDEKPEPIPVLVLTRNVEVAERLHAAGLESRPQLECVAMETLDDLRVRDVFRAVAVDESLIPGPALLQQAVAGMAPVVVLQRSQDEERSLAWIAAGADEVCLLLSDVDNLGFRRAVFRAFERRRASRPRTEGPVTPAITVEPDFANSLASALAREEFELVYQPQVDVAERRVTGLEALLRWHHPDYGQLLPDYFIAAAEHTGLIHDMGNWLLRRACEQLRDWEGQGLEDVHVAVNVSPYQLHNGEASFVHEVRQALTDTLIDPRRLELELTESAGLLGNVEALHQADALAQLGVRLAVDDFGRGYTSIAYLRHLQLSRIKIDREFVSGLPWNTRDFLIVESISHLARSFGLEVLAEGVETQEQVATLRGFGCNSMQGFLFGHPLSAKETADLLRDPAAIAW